jgi:UDP-N-acetylglucosamine diphosphorylase / glucose-1-phosphate thymidylyltransferase / UDP-N-acetylgalactosamine diphosphorylase / glucosamine-1-phosphate N-acetyltransferase / galactosamine-1-phosphate N-acetyltransferase
VNKAIVLAAGRGTRMGDLTEQMPKPMLSLAGKPIIEHILDRLRAAGTTEVFIVTGYRAETIERHLRDYPIQVTFRRQDNINGTGTAALLAREFAGPDPVLLTFGDIICESEEYEGISSLEAAAVLGVKHVEDPYQGAAVYEENGAVTRIVEKPPKGTSTTHWNSAGLYTFRPVIFEHLANLEPSPRGEYELTDAVASLIAAGERVLLYPIRGGWRDVGRPEDLSAAEQLVD